MRSRTTIGPSWRSSRTCITSSHRVFATRIALERFSPYHQSPDLGFSFRRPAAFYDHVYDLPTRELMDIVFIFDTPDGGIDAEVERVILDGAAAWQRAYFTSTLTYEQRGDELVILDRRAHREPRDHVLREPWQVLGYQALMDGHGASSLAKALGHVVFAPGAAEVEEWLDWLAAEGLVFGDGGRFVALATSETPAKVPVDVWR